MFFHGQRVPLAPDGFQGIDDAGPGLCRFDDCVDVAPFSRAVGVGKVSVVILRCRGIPWREDSSNEDLRHTRNFLRRSLLPLAVERVNAGAIEHLAAFAEEMRGYREEEERRGAELAESLGVKRFYCHHC